MLLVKLAQFYRIFTCYENLASIGFILCCRKRGRSRKLSRSRQVIENAFEVMASRSRISMYGKIWKCSTTCQEVFYTN
ncbi:uncharacterized protein LOC143461141 isoform X2 [Clavelina lepadiformis]|uniref:uncharacterized protein LOC143461141 isoform X2 n=1 Tax=Clavelina lepadiformis TaxID=159417 RepID=UPI0040437783